MDEDWSFLRDEKHWCGVPDGFFAYFGGDDQKDIVYVGLNNQRIEAVGRQLAFFHPQKPSVTIPAWDVRPYDRLSPAKHIMAARLRAFDFLSRPHPPCFILIAGAALLQRIMPQSHAQGLFMRLSRGQAISMKTVQTRLLQEGYQRTDLVIEAGYFAVRGGILDVFCADGTAPHRLDFLGDRLEDIRSFDPRDQLTTGSVETLEAGPCGEVVLNAESRDLFCRRFRGLFGQKALKHPLYEAVRDGFSFQGMEQWLPLFYPQTRSLFEVLPPKAGWYVEQIALDLLSQTDQLIRHYYRDRQDPAATALRPEAFKKAAAKSSKTPQDKALAAFSLERFSYCPVPPDLFYLSAAEALERLASRDPVYLRADIRPKELNLRDKGIRLPEDFSAPRLLGENALNEAVSAYSRARPRARKVIAFRSDGARRHRLQRLQASEGPKAPPVLWEASWKDLQKEPPAPFYGLVGPFFDPLETPRLSLLTEQAVWGVSAKSPPAGRRRLEDVIASLEALQPGDWVVHEDHGIGRFECLRRMEVAGAPYDCLELHYEGGDKLFVPVDHMSVLTRYGSHAPSGRADKLGGMGWSVRKARAQKKIKDIAEELLRIHAGRLLSTAPAMEKDTSYEAFCRQFPYEETEDQQRAIEDVLQDLGRAVPMDRLICGDVGFGKTEVALRAAFIAASCGYQVAVLAPTTLLVRQHYLRFEERMASFGFSIASLSRFVSAPAAKKTKQALADGTLRIVVGTHALLSKGISFKNLGLVIVDEEQHFGVVHKERLKLFKKSTHVLSLSATPIPRTLKLALSGLKDLSLITTPPRERLAVQTYLIDNDPVHIREILMAEKQRGGQVYYVCPRIGDLQRIGALLERLVPEMRFAIAHGQKPAAEIEAVMEAFMNRRIDILLCSNIIESGLDNPHTNTILINRPQLFGLGQLYQLRGRVGRSKIAAFAYLLADQSLTAPTRQRLSLLQSLDTLGAGFTLASHDLDLRGGGNILGEEQSGHLEDIGSELYQHMLEEAVIAIQKGEIPLQPAPGGSRKVVFFEEAAQAPKASAVQLDLHVPVYIPVEYIPDLAIRMAVYRRLSAVEDIEALHKEAMHLMDRFGPLPQEAAYFLDILELKLLCRRGFVSAVAVGDRGVLFSFFENRFPDPLALMDYLRKKVVGRLRPDHKVYFSQIWNNPSDRLGGIKGILYDFIKIAQKAAPKEESPPKAPLERETEKLSS